MTFGERVHGPRMSQIRGCSVTNMMVFGKYFNSLTLGKLNEKRNVAWLKERIDIW